ncbi:MAG: hypothetical protein GX872_02745 [Firmicutes bacterium]|nr:hypothetical protein [Bacillota bacterium]HXL04880.1 type II and III secretion system protein [Bacillota bacterium]
MCIAKQRYLSLMLTLVMVVFMVPGIASAEEKLLSVDFFNNDINSAAADLAYQANVTILVDDYVQGIITLALTDVTVDQVLEVMCLKGDCGYKKVSKDLYVIGPIDPTSPTFQKHAVTEVVSLVYEDAEKVMMLLKHRQPYLSGSGKTIVVRAWPSQVGAIIEEIRALDLPNRQVSVKVVVTEIADEIMKEFGSDLFSYTFNAGQVKNPAWITKLGFEAGVISAETDVYGAILATLKMLEGKGKAKIQGDPQVVVMDGESANLFLGENRIILIPGDSGYVGRLEQFDTGLKLAVTPRIYGDDIILELNPTISYVVNNNKDSILLRKSDVASVVKVAQGESLVLATMTITEESKSNSGVPLLGQIPLIRWLFSKDTSLNSHRQLVVFVVPEAV